MKLRGLLKRNLLRERLNLFNSGRTVSWRYSSSSMQEACRKARSGSGSGEYLFSRSVKLVLISFAKFVIDPCAGLLQTIFRGVPNASSLIDYMLVLSHLTSSQSTTYSTSCL